MPRTHTTSVGTFVGGGATIVVVAVGYVVHIRTARCRQTGVVGAHVVVVAYDRCSGFTFATAATITGSAGVSVITNQRIGHNQTATRRITGVVGTGVGVVTVDGRAAFAGAAAAFVGRGTQVAVVAIEGVVLIRTSHSRCAGVVGAGVVVVAVWRRPSFAYAILALVPGGAGAAVAACGRIGDNLTTTDGVTRIIGAGVGIITGGCRAADTNSANTGIIGGA